MTEQGFAPFPIVDWVARRSRRQIVAFATVVAAYLAWRSLGWLARVLLDRWWLAELTDASVWSTRTGAMVLLATTAGALSIAMMMGAWVQANAVPAPTGQLTFRPIAFVAGRLGPCRTWAAWLLPIYFGLRIMAAATQHWQEWILFRNGAPTGQRAPVVGYDLSYHLFTLPLADTVLGWLSSLLAATVIGTWILLVLNGALRLHVRGRRSNPKAIRLLLSLAAAFFVVQGLRYWLVSYPALASSNQGRFAGASWAEMHSRGLAYRPLAVLCIVAAIALVASVTKTIRFRYSFAIAGAVAVLHVAFVVALTPALQRFVVNPSEFAREEPYIEHQLTNTKAAYGLSDVSVETLALNPSAPSQPNSKRVPRFDAGSLAAPFQALQGKRGTKITDVDLDRYDIDGTSRPVFIAARNAAVTELPDRSWVNTHLVYTHGDGVVATLADTTTAAGGINFGGLQTTLGDADTPLYFGEGLDNWYVVVGTDRPEVSGNSYRGDAGVSIASTWRQLVAGIGLRDYNLMTSSEIGAQAQLLYRRSINERIANLAPFLAIDADPYPVITANGVVWMVDTYVTSATYPYSQRADKQSLPKRSGLARRGVNYLQHAAVATIDARTGEVALYQTGDSPLLTAWNRAFPGLFRSVDALPAELARHRRYPSDAYTVQTNMLGRYHVTTPAQLYSGDDAWLISPNVQAADDDAAPTPAGAVWQFVDALGGNWSSTRPMSPGQAKNPTSGRDELAAVAVGDHDAGALTLYRLSSTTPAQLPSPQVAQSILASDPDVSQLLTLLNANGSTVVFGPNTPLIANDGLWWYRTIVVNSTAKVSTPRLHSAFAINDNGVQVTERSESAALDARGS